MSTDLTDKEAPMIPVVPAYATCGVWAFMWHLAVSLLHLLGIYRSSYDDLKVNPTGNVVYGQTCRCLFALLWTKIMNKSGKALITPFHHHSFIRMMKKTGHQLDVMDVEEDNVTLVPPSSCKPGDYDMIVISHMLGRDYKFEWVKDWKKINPSIVIVEDRVQGGLISEEREDLAHVSLYSLGQDKLPNAMGGGYAVVHNSPKIQKLLVEAVESLPFESAWERFWFLTKKIPTVAIYNIRPLCSIIEYLLRLSGLTRTQLTDTYRKKNPGFMHEGYMIRPSGAMMHSIRGMNGLPFWEAMQVECDAKYKEFLSHIEPDLRKRVMVCGSDASCCYFFIRLPDLTRSRERLARRGIVTISNQTFLPLDESNAEPLENMCTLPSLYCMSSEEIKFIAEAVTECWTKDL